MAKRRIFWGFCKNWFLIDPLHYLSSCSNFGFEFADIFVIEKRLPDSASPRVGGSPTRESAFECLKVNLASRRVGDSPTRWLGELPWWVGESLLEFFKIYHRFPNFKRLNQPFSHHADTELLDPLKFRGACSSSLWREGLNSTDFFLNQYHQNFSTLSPSPIYKQTTIKEFNITIVSNCKPLSNCHL
jgi:hypothetical protein